MEKRMYAISSFCQNGCNHCVAVARTETAVFVRDTRRPDGAELKFSRREWSAFIQGVKEGQFDLR